MIIKKNVHKDVPLKKDAHKDEFKYSKMLR